MDTYLKYQITYYLTVVVFITILLIAVNKKTRYEIIGCSLALLCPFIDWVNVYHNIMLFIQYF